MSKREFLMRLLLGDFWRAEDGQDLVEYSLLLGFIALVAVAGLAAIRNDIAVVWNDIGDALSNGIASAS